MEPDPTKPVERSGFSKRRISSILKAPRKSARFPDTEQQENVVACANPVEKRNSRRVSFAPANDVLMFPTDAKNASPGRSPFQELMAATAAPQNRGQVGVIDDGSQHITGMESLLNAPLHDCQQTDEANLDPENDFGEKTMHEAFMDMTHSHTINIASGADLPRDISLQNNDVLPADRNKTVMFPVDPLPTEKTPIHTGNMAGGSVTLFSGKNVNLSLEKKNVLGSMSCLDPEFENFLASLLIPKSPSANLVITRVTPPAGLSSEETNSSLVRIKTQRPDVDKENQVPSSVSAVMGKSLNNTRRTVELPAAFCPEDPVNMGMTEGQTGHILGVSDDADPFQWLFPSQDMYAHSDRRVSQTIEMETKEQHSSKTSGSTDLKHQKSSMNPPLHTHHQGYKVNSDIKDECREKRIMFTADEVFMDMTQNHTVNITSGSLAAEQMSLKGFDPGFKNFLTSHSQASGPSSNPVIARIPPTAASSSKETIISDGFLSQLKMPRADVDKDNRSLNTSRMFGELIHRNTTCPNGDVSMDMTEDQTGPILGCDVSMDITEAQAGQIISDLDDALQHLLPTQDMHPQSESLKKAEVTSSQQSSDGTGPFNCKGVETLKTSLKTQMQIHRVKCDGEVDCKENTVRFTADEACMDMTQSHTVNISTDLQSPSHQNVDFLHANGEKTVRFTTDDAAMDVTRSHTVNIATHFQQKSQNVDILPTCGEKTVRFIADDAAMDVTKSHTVNIATHIQPKSQNVDILPVHGEKTVRFTADDAAMDVTKSHTVNIAMHFDPKSQNAELLPTHGEKTVRFTADDAVMDVTKSHTVNIATHIQPKSQNAELLPTHGEKTVRFTADDAAMDVTKSHTVNIATHFQPKLQNVDILSACGEKTVRFTGGDAAMDVTRSHTVNIATDFMMQSHQSVDFIPEKEEKMARFGANEAAMDVTKSHTVNTATHIQSKSKNMDPQPRCGEKMERFTANDEDMDMTQCTTVNIASNSTLDSVSLHQDFPPIHKNMDFPCAVQKGDGETCGPHRDTPLSEHSLDKDLSEAGVTDTNDYLVQFKTQKHDMNVEIEASGLVLSAVEEPVNKTMTDCPEILECMDMTEAQTGYILGQTHTDENHQCLSSSQNPDSEHFKKMEVTSPQSNRTQGSFSPDNVGITNLRDSLNSSETTDRREPEPISLTCPLPQKMESSPRAADHDADMEHSRKSRQISLADLQSKVRRLSHIINTAPDAIPMDCCTAPFPRLDHDLKNDSKDKTISPVVEPEPEIVNTEDNTEDQCLTAAEQPPASMTATPFSLKTKQLMSRLSVGGFKPKLPQISKPDDSKKVNSARQRTRTITVNVSNHLSNFDNDVSDIYDEELGSYEDMSETLDPGSPQKISEKDSASQDLNMFVGVPLVDNVFQDNFISSVVGQKRPLPEDGNMEKDKRRKASTETIEMTLQSGVMEYDSNITTAPPATQTIDSSNSSQTASIRCEATFESTFKQSLFESQLEDFASDVQEKLEDGTITVLEFFKLFNIDFVIHNPRQSVRPGKLSSDTEVTPMDLLKDRHISHPKQMVYETDVLALTEKVEKLKVRMGDLDKPLKAVNRPLWEEMRYSSEKELKSFGAKLKERNNFFRKTSKVQSHEMKEVLYLNLVQANLEEQQKLRGTIEKADEMIKSLDECICELETELAAVEDKGFENKQSLKSLEEEMQKVIETSADNERQISELELQRKQNSSKLKRLKAETRNLESHLDMLNTLNEWKLKERRDDFIVYTFLHDTMQLQLVYAKSDGEDADGGSERKIAHVTFKFKLDDEKSQCHARLVHKLVSQYIDRESAWTEKYPTRRHVPKLLHDVSLVVSHCRLLGEECHLLKQWGSLPFDILDISCTDTRVRIVFSSLKKFSKFEVVFAIRLTNHHCVLQVESFKNMIGSTTIQQIEEIVASVTPAKNLLTNIVKKVHETLLS